MSSLRLLEVPPEYLSINRRVRHVERTLPHYDFFISPKSWKYSVVSSIFIPVALSTVWATFWTTVLVVLKIRGITSSFATLVSVVISLLLVFRTNGAYDRFYEGRRLWAQITSTIRNTARTIWSSCPDEDEEDMAQKLIAMNLLIALPISLKHHLRGQHGIQGASFELQEFLPPLPEFSQFNRHEFAQAVNAAAHTHKGASTPPMSPNMSQRAISHRSVSHPNHQPTAAGASSNSKEHYHDYSCNCVKIPFEICNLLNSYVGERRKKEQIHFMAGSGLGANISNLVDTTTGLERILSTPIPLAYRLHLKHTLALYFIILPFQLVNDLSWLTIPCVFLVTFIFLGIEKIGEQIEEPFGTDANDLPIEEYCEIIREDIVLLMARRASSAASWRAATDGFSTLNAKNGITGTPGSPKSPTLPGSSRSPPTQPAKRKTKVLLKSQAANPTTDV
ncbi:Bestrophin, RFP-TM, chloride channel-domain-containing protein [Polychytrium aggregatum]|uniref:Bestrophin, RFP-TM, chloride channel-domain-containing protein n=1 Tax=Polychytrium aggregatum TaxID=110093 RepID=UPI0022FDE849|nr:Bestrophin, RFP-TM, chloride channel-domain-containing protein [Polychytrium aggregatum]KAI9204890.1 Bestrophin, RFP-TM, chloride channel-domain-containing protein [Polychytrium aggregatum]